jgi:hypothetical protein
MNEWSFTATLYECRHGEDTDNFVSASKADVSVFREFVIYCHVIVKFSNVTYLFAKHARCTYKHFVS